MGKPPSSSGRTASACILERAATVISISTTNIMATNPVIGIKGAGATRDMATGKVMATAKAMGIKGMAKVMVTDMADMATDTVIKRDMAMERADMVTAMGTGTIARLAIRCINMAIIEGTAPKLAARCAMIGTATGMSFAAAGTLSSITESGYDLTD